MNSKTAIVTGCNKGIGLATLKKISSSGAKVFACVRNIDEKFSNILNDLNSKNIIPIEFDLNDRDKVKKADFDNNGKIKLDNRPVHMNTLTNHVQSILPKKRVY